MKARFFLAVILTLVITGAALAEGPASTAVDRGIRLYEAQKLDAAIDILRQAASQGSSDGRAHYYTGRAYFDKGQYKESAGWFEQAVERVPGNAEYHLWLGRAYGSWARESNMFRKMSLAGDIKREFVKAVELDPENLDARGDLISFYLEAPGVAGGDKEKALEQAKEIKSRDPIQGHFALGRVYESKEEPEKAANEFRSAIKLDPKDDRAYFRLAYLQQRGEDFDGAHETFMALAKAMPDDLSAQYQIGRNAAMSGKHLEEAAASLRRYLEEHQPGDDGPSNAWAHCRLGQVYGHMGKREQARAEFDEALKLDPDHKEAKKALKDLK